MSPLCSQEPDADLRVAELCGLARSTSTAAVAVASAAAASAPMRCRSPIARATHGDLTVLSAAKLTAVADAQIDR